MARRRADEEPGLIERVRWRNVGRLVVLLAVGLIVLLEPRGCGRREAVLPPEVRVAPPAPPPAASAPEKAERPRPTRRPRHHKRRPYRARHRRRRAPKPPPT